MNLAKKAPVSINSLYEKSDKAILDWFEQHLQSFYILAWCYFSNQQQMEEALYRTIIQVQKEWPRYKGKTPFERWVTSIFILSCRELSSDGKLQVSAESEPQQDLFKALNQLDRYEKEGIVLIYVHRFSLEEAAQLLQVSTEKLKEHLVSGIQSLRNKMRSASNFNGCKEYRKDYIDYIERAIDRPRKIEFEIHIYHCQQCQEDLASFQDVMLMMLSLTDQTDDLHVPPSLFGNVKDKLIEREDQKQLKNKKRKKMGFAFASVIVLLIGIAFYTGALTHLYYAWTEENPEVRTFLQQGLGQRLNLEVENEGVKVKIKSVIADDLQTLVFYEIEDTNEDNQYLLSYGDGIYVLNEYEIMDNRSYPPYYPPDLKSEINNREKNVFQGKMSLLPLKTENGTIELKITELQKLIRDSSGRYGYGDYENKENKIGEWSFEIPVSKKPSIKFALNEVVEVEGVPVRFDKLTIAPTATVLQFGINNQQEKKWVESIQFNDLEMNNQKLKVDLYGNSFVGPHFDMDWKNYQIQYEPFYGEIPKEVNVQLGSAYLRFEENKMFKFDNNEEYPQTFEYASSIISIDKKEIGQSTYIILSNHEIANRSYESLDFNIISEDANQFFTDMNSEGVIVDKYGVEYDINEFSFSFTDIEQPRYFNTVQSIGFPSDNYIPKKLEIHGYYKTKYLDDVVKINLK